MDTAPHVTLSELRERVTAAHREQRSLRLRGAGTKDFYGEAIEGELLDLRPYRGIVDYEPSELVITARCGTPLSEIEAVLKHRGQFLAFEPPAFNGDPTIGGVIAAGLSGPRRMYAGAARDFVLGVTLLDARGEILRFGGQVMKNVAGFDVSRLLCGTLGILGALTEVSLKVLPQPRAEETLRFEMPEQQAVAAFNRWSGTATAAIGRGLVQRTRLGTTIGGGLSSARSSRTNGRRAHRFNTGSPLVECVTPTTRTPSSETTPSGDYRSPTRRRPWTYPATLSSIGAEHCAGMPTAPPPTR